MFDRWGRFVYRRRLAVLGLSLLVLAVSGVLAASGGRRVKAGGAAGSVSA